MRYLGLIFLSVLFSFAAQAALPPILGVTVVCTGATTTLSNIVPSGTWSSSDVTVATIGSSTGVVTGVAAGTTTITYTDGTDFAYQVMTVNASPTPVTGPSTICTGATVTFTSTPAGGSWSSTTSAVAPIGTGTGVVTGVSAGTTIISYTGTNGCTSTAALTVYPIPSITGPSAVCIGAPVTFSGMMPGGTWNSDVPSVATIDGAGLLTGLTTGTTTITYAISGCSNTKIVTVNTAVGPITGTPQVCVGLTTALSNSTSGGTWVSTSPSVGTVGVSTGVVTGIGTGTTIISYIISSGCAASVVVTVNTTPGSITGTATLCAGATTTLSPTGGAGGTWASGATAVATVSASGIVYGAGVGTAAITYTAGVCGSATRVVTVSSSCSGTPVPGAITASAPLVCIGTPLTLNLPAYTPVCGHLKQWQYSADGASWSDLPGANTVPYTYNPTAAYYYRCKLTCASSGLSAFSGPVYVAVNYSIGSHTAISDAGLTYCDLAHFTVTACGVSSAFSVVTSFGDGTTVTSAMPSGSVSFDHMYSMAGTYTVRHELYVGSTPVDTVVFSFSYLPCYTLPVLLYADNNGNCAKDVAEPFNVTPVAIRIDSNSVPIDTVLITSGTYYRARGGVGTIYAFRPVMLTGGVVSACAGGVVYDTIVSTSDIYPARYIGLSCGGALAHDLRVSATSIARQTFQTFEIVVSNPTCATTSATVMLKFSPKYAYYSASPAPASVGSTVITWNLTGLNSFSSRTISVRVQRPSSLAPLLPGDTANAIISVTPTTGDLDTTNNIIIRTDTVRAGYDPNDLTVTPAGYILPCTWLEYRVRFENTGNDTARNIHVLDTLPAGVIPATLEVLSASHGMTASVVNDGVRNIAKFDFAGINLPDSSHHNLCNGMFTFRIKTLTALPDGTDIMNRVGIYFDENAVVMTNQVNNIIGIAPIQGPDHVCLGHPDTMSNTTPGGVWASSTPATGTIAANGIVTGIVAGTTVISYTVSNSCTSRTATKTVTVSPIAVPTVTVSTPDLTVCSGSPVIFTAVPAHGGTTPAYVWSVNGTIVSAGMAYSYLPATGDMVSVMMTSSEACTLPNVVADTITMTVLPTGMPVALISVSPNDTTCATTPATFIATNVMGGAAPGYQWYVNSALSGTGATYTYTPANGDVVHVRMGSNYQCRTADTVASGTINMTVDPLYLPIISIAAIPGLTVNAGDPITFVANVIDGGPMPIYEWYVNSTPVAGVTTGTFTTTTLSDYDSVTCRVTGSGTCSITSFNSVFVTILPVGVPHVSGDVNVSIFPNPNNGDFRIKANMGGATTNDVLITVNDMLGRTVYNALATPRRGSIDTMVQLPASVANGVYMLGLRNGNELKVFRFVVDR
ncbi:hypothetical protein GCM10023093_07720 [Nemorincola caseinilytica]|uniref:T9SS type A sorting domain-containing protein n=1 Tax=Nemorincola caseinilytica TaxID=2054315 RepID=A0ABP8N951_9BACT